MEEDIVIKELDQVVVRFSGDSGDGMQLAGNIFSTISATVGNDISTFPDYPADIRAPQGSLTGVSGFQVHIGDGTVYTPGDRCDVLVAMNAAALKTQYKYTRPQATIIIDTDSFGPNDLRKADFLTDDYLGELGIDPDCVVACPITTMVKHCLEDSGMDNKSILKCRNMFALGMVCWLFDRNLELAEEFLHHKFGKKPQVAEANIRVVHAGYDYAHNTHAGVPATYRIETHSKVPGRYMDITGNKATAYGLIAAAEKAGLKLYLGSYPITPATDILHELSKHKSCGVITVQCEDEISGCASAVGAAFAGALAATSTSGPGICLKSEAINLAVIDELPLVIIDVQRGGPSTGLPTKSEQTDLLQVLNTADAALSELEDMLNGVDLTPAEDITHEKIIAQIDKVIAALQRVCNRTDDAVLVDRLEAAIDRLETLKSAVEQSGLSHVQDELRQVIEEVRELLRTAAVKTNQQVNAYIQKAGERAQSTLGSVQEILTASSGALGGVSGTLRSYSSAISAAQPTLAASVTLAESVSGYLADMEEDVRRITDSAAFKRFVELMASDSDSMAAYLASPVQMNTQIIYEIKDYGAAMSPYYVMLALFVGSLLTAVMVKVPVTQPKFQPCRAIERYFGRFLTFFFMAIAQALVTAFGCLHFVGMEAAEPALFVLACCICSLNFAFMNYALVYSLDNVGLAISVIIMVLQVAGSGGSYPIDVLPALFRSLYPFMPFHYGMDMIRETIGGMYGQTYLHCALLLLGMCVLFTIFGLLVYYPARKLNAVIAASKEKSGIM